MLALIIAALMQLGVISSPESYNETFYQSNYDRVHIIIDDEYIN